MTSPLPQGWRSSLLSGGDENTASHLILFFLAPTWQGEYLVTQGKGGILGSLLNLYWGVSRGIMQLCSEIFLSFLSFPFPGPFILGVVIVFLLMTELQMLFLKSKNKNISRYYILSVFRDCHTVLSKQLYQFIFPPSFDFDQSHSSPIRPILSLPLFPLNCDYYLLIQTQGWTGTALIP